MAVLPVIPPPGRSVGTMIAPHVLVVTAATAPPGVRATTRIARVATVPAHRDRRGATDVPAMTVRDARRMPEVSIARVAMAMRGLSDVKAARLIVRVVMAMHGLSDVKAVRLIARVAMAMHVPSDVKAARLIARVAMAMHVPTVRVPRVVIRVPTVRVLTVRIHVLTVRVVRAAIAGRPETVDRVPVHRAVSIARTAAPRALPRISVSGAPRSPRRSPRVTCRERLVTSSRRSARTMRRTSLAIS
ncbi:hypothetical protein [Microbacterium sp. RURRCA19A]|uniref:hypothetical protein n=1 Tax=Microbacterium sp. RURRCA19A TaxID=1907391 RepID=UPI000954BD68|nr:hypothetical protein [Microbacterium sp. RURRCA19A]SIR65601.1 hypothetical protein SAMN05880568_0846 [Microbacterium sp. RURRCA19A]